MNQEHPPSRQDGLLIGETAIASYADGPLYRGYAVADLAAGACFEEVVFLLLCGELPSQEQLADLRALLAEAYNVPAPVLELLPQFPLHTSALDGLRTALSALGHFDSQGDDPAEPATLEQALRLLAQLVTLVAAQHRVRLGLPLVEPHPELSLAGNVRYLLTGHEPRPADEHALDVALLLNVEPEFHAATLAARIIAATRSDLHAPLVAALGAWNNPQHSDAACHVWYWLQHARGERDPEAWLRGLLAQRRMLPGFAPAAAPAGDPRAAILREYCRRRAQAVGQQSLEDLADTLERVVWQERRCAPHLEWPSARLFHYLGLDVGLFAPVLLISRAVGWCAHAREQAAHHAAVRVRSRYVGPPRRSFVPLADRGDEPEPV